MTRILIWTLLLALGACATTTPANLSEAKSALVAYYEDGRYEAEIARIAVSADNWIRSRAPGSDERLAIVLDIDETAVSNWTRIRLNDFGEFRGGPCDLRWGPCGALAWEELATAPAIKPIRRLSQTAREAGTAVIFISARPEGRREATERLLYAAGYSGWERLILRPQAALGENAAIFKASARRDLERDGWTIIANVGDQDSDLSGGHAERTYKLPNPFYFTP